MASKGKTILVVEDDFSIRELMQHVLEAEGYDVSVAENGQDAIDVLNAKPKPALIVLDLTMPVMNGLEFLEYRRQDSQLTKVPVLVVSAIADDKNTAGATAFIRKPADLNVLLALVDRYST